MLFSLSVLAPGVGSDWLVANYFVVRDVQNATHVLWKHGLFLDILLWERFRTEAIRLPCCCEGFVLRTQCLWCGAPTTSKSAVVGMHKVSYHYKAVSVVVLSLQAVQL